MSLTVNRFVTGSDITKPWPGQDDKGKTVSDGMYIVQLIGLLSNGQYFETSKNTYADRSVVIEQAAKPAPQVTSTTPTPQTIPAVTTITASPSTATPQNQSLTTVKAQPVCKEFPDVKTSNRYYEDIEWARKNGIFEGFADCSFKGRDPLSRAEFVTIVLRAFNIPRTGEAKSRFSDVQKSQWFHNAVVTAEDQKMVQGYADNQFKPGNALTYDEFFRLLFNAAGLAKEVAKIGQIQSNICPDVKDRTQWFMSDFQYANNKGLLEKNDNCNPGSTINRFEAAKFLHRYGKIK